MRCSNGRNALDFYQRGFNITAIDNNPGAIDMLENIIIEERMNNIKAHVYDIHNASIGESYGFITCTVTLDPARVNTIITDMHKSTQNGGYNLIVYAMSTEECPCPVPFPFTFKSGHLRDAYDGWELIKYNEDIGTMHNGAKLQFATILARKPD